MSRHKRYVGATRDAGGFIAIPWSVIDSDAYACVGAHAKVLLIEIARQLRGDNNGALLCSRAYMATRGWNSSDMLTKCKRELIAAGLIYETVIGQRPNKAAWYAVTWMGLDKLDGFDAGAAAGFERGLYRRTVQKKNARLVPPHGTGGAPIAPSYGTEARPPVPPHGPIEPVFRPISVPWDGHHLEKPSAAGTSACPPPSFQNFQHRPTP
ncbi:MAG: hypothetical protein EON54_00240 [Alcaligenaceae bacterium]|nr:MAG: hypothetical protein EON54_00240 [Alcaligenaceae bacterium]